MIISGLQFCYLDNGHSSNAKVDHKTGVVKTLNWMTAFKINCSPLSAKQNPFCYRGYTIFMLSALIIDAKTFCREVEGVVEYKRILFVIVVCANNYD